jgi:hypothetical protein
MQRYGLSLSGDRSSALAATVRIDLPDRSPDFAKYSHGSRRSGARMCKDGNRSDDENYRNDYPAVAIKLLRARKLLIVIEDCRDQNFDQRKEDKQGAD